MYNIYFRSVKELKLNKIDTIRVGSWINVCNPSQEEIEIIVKDTKIDKSLILDALDQYEVPRVEQKRGIIYVFARYPEEKKGEITTSPLLIAIGKDFVLTLSKEACSFLDFFISNDKKLYTTQKIKFFLMIFFAINKEYNNILININKKIRSIKFRLEKISKSDIVQFIDFEKVLNDFLSALEPIKPVLQNLLNGRHLDLYEEDKNLIEDLFFGNNQLIEMSKSTLRHVVNIRDAYSNILTHDLNRVIKVLTVMTIILTIPTMIFSFFGMNVRLPFSDSHFGTLGIILFTVAASYLLYLLIKKRWM